MIRKIRSLAILIAVMLFACSSVFSKNPAPDHIERLMQQENYYQALLEYTKALRHHTAQRNFKLAAEKIYRISTCLLPLKEYENFERIVAIGKTVALSCNTSVYDKLLVAEASYMVESGKYREAMRVLRRHIPEMNDKNTLYDAMLTLGDVYYRIDSSEACRREFTKVYQQTGDSLQKARSSNAIGSCLFLKSAFDSAAFYYQQALVLYTQQLGAFHSRTLKVKYNLGLLDSRKGDYASAEKKLTEVRKALNRKFGAFHPQIADAYAVLGGVLLKQGNVEKAIYYFKKDRSILEKLYGKTQPDLLYSYLNCGTAYSNYQDYVNAEIELRKALELADFFYNNKHNLYSQCAVELARVFIEKLKFNEAEDLLNHVIANHESKLDYFLADAYLELGNSFLKQKIHAEAIRYYEQAAILYTALYGDKNVYTAEALKGMSKAYLNDKRFTEANTFAVQALEQTRAGKTILHHYDYWECMLQRIKCRKALYENKLAVPADIRKDITEILQVIKKANTIKHTYYQAGSKLNHAQKMAELNEIAIYYLIRFYKAKDDYFFNHVLMAAENNKAGLLRSRLTDNSAKALLPKAAQSQHDAIITRLNYFMIQQEEQAETDYVINDSVLYYQEKYEAYIKTIEQKYPEIYALKYGEKALTVKQIQQKLKADQTFLEYFNDGQNYYCLIITAENRTLKKCGTLDTVNALVASLRKSITEKAYHVQTGYRLYKLLLPEMLNTQLIISPDQQLQLLTFDALTRHAAKPDYLVYTHSTVYAFSAATYFRNPVQASDNTIVGFYPDFSGSPYSILNTQKESEALSAQPAYKQFAAVEANKRAFIKQSAKAGIVHIASHLISDSVAPLNSYLLFQPVKDCRLTINDVSKLNLHADLVTLAACQTNFGKAQSGEGMLNFAWAFIYSGAQNILSTHWDASDKASSEIISQFYSMLFSGNAKATALQKAKKAYLSQSDAVSAQPYFWSNYVLYATHHEHDTRSSFITYICLSVIALMVLLLYNSKK
jgi:CHAT domain-containing protein